MATAPPCDPVGFSITAPETLIEHVVSSAVGGLGAVHQYVTMRAWVRWANAQQRSSEEQQQQEELTPTALLAGVIYNDFPWGDELGTAREYTQHVLVRFSSASVAPYVTDARFRLQPNREIQWASAAAYKALPDVVTRAVAGVSQARVVEARRMLDERTADERVVYHFLRASANEPDSEVQQRAVEKCAGWFAAALQTRSLFALGHAWHTIEDSFSPAHTDRNLSDRRALVRRVYYFGDQTDRWHSSHESWAAVRTPGSEGYRRVDAAVPLLAESLRRFYAALDDNAPDAAAVHTERFAQWLRTEVFALASDSPQQEEQ